MRLAVSTAAVGCTGGVLTQDDDDDQMDQLLAWITTSVNIVGLAVALCLGFRVVARTPGRRRSWLAAPTLWSLTSLFTYNALALNVPEGRTTH